MRTELQDNGCCFVCGKNNTIGLKLLFVRKLGSSEAEFIPSKELQGYSGIVHGGIISAVLDEAMIQASMSEENTPVTAEITVRFRNPLKVDEQAAVYASVKKRAGRLIEAEAAMRKKGDNTLIAEAHAKLMCKS